jgi:transposase
MTGEKGLSVLEAVALYKGLTEVESGSRQLKDVMALGPIYHQVEPRVEAHIFVAALALLVPRLLGRRLEEAGLDLSPVRAMQALSTVRRVSFRLEGQAERRGMAGGCPDARPVRKALRLVDQRPPAPPEGEDSVM